MDELRDDVLVCEKVKRSVMNWSSDDPAVPITKSESFAKYRKLILFKQVFIVLCVILAIIVTGYSLTIGSQDISFFECYKTIWNHITGNIENIKFDHVIINIRLPRIACGIIAGAGLAVAGVAMQSILKNPLADPYTTGVSSGAGFGATVAMTTGMTLVAGSYA